MFYGASEGRMLTRILRKMQTSDPSASLRVKVPEPFVSQVSKIARPGHPARGKSRFLTAKAVRNDKKEKVLGCGTAEAVPSRPLRTRTPAPHGAKFPRWEKGEFCTCGMLASVEFMSSSDGMGEMGAAGKAAFLLGSGKNLAGGSVRRKTLGTEIS